MLTVTLFADVSYPAMGIAFIHQISTSTSDTFLTPLFSIAFSLNVLLTLMIVMRLTLHGRKIRNAFGAPTEANRLYKAVTAMLIESLALYSVIALLYFALRTANNPAQFIFYYAMLEAQVRIISISPTYHSSLGHVF